MCRVLRRRWDAIRPRADRPERSRPRRSFRGRRTTGSQLYWRHGLEPRPVGRTRIRSADRVRLMVGDRRGAPLRLQTRSLRRRFSSVSASAGCRSCCFGRLFSLDAPTGVRPANGLRHTSVSRHGCFLLAACRGRRSRSSRRLKMRISEHLHSRRAGSPKRSDPFRGQNFRLAWHEGGKGRMDPEADPAFCECELCSIQEERIGPE